MSNILIHMLVEPHGEYDIFSPTDYSKMSENFRSQNKRCPNLGNRLWFQGLISEISVEENNITYFREDMSKDYINETFDMIVAPMANVFHAAFSDLLLRLVERFRGIRIPVYVIACGVQADNYERIDELCDAIGEPARAFMRSVYETGGEFALRGYFSKQFFDRMGFSSAVVTGCPSMYQLGRDFQVSTQKVSEQDFRPLLNGDLNDYKWMTAKYSDTEFFDQERFFHVLHDPNEPLNIQSLVRRYGFENAKWLLEEKIQLIPNMNDWRNYLQHKEFHFSFGSRIHGSIMPILAGIPALIDPIDSRTREMAEFFEIPIFGNQVAKCTASIYELYLQTDYSTFNRNYMEKFDAFEHFLVQHNIVKSINQKNVFFHEEMANVMVGNHTKLSCMRKKFNRRQWMWQSFDALVRWKQTVAVRLK